MENKENTTRFQFLAIDKKVERNIVLPTESADYKGERISWGDGNAYPDYLLDLCATTPTLRSIINGNVDFIAGNDVLLHALEEGKKVNRKGQNIRDIVREIARNLETYGGFALQVIRSKDGRDIAELYALDMRYVRSNKENDVFYYSEDWRGWNSRKSQQYPKFITWGEEGSNLNSIYFYKNTTTSVYPSPLYAASIKACEIERGIDDYHLNAIENGFVPSVIINFNNGLPSDEVKKELEKSVQEKYSGHSNGGRILLSFNESKDNAATFDYPKVEDFGARYDALAKHSRQQIFTAFRANPNLFGIPTESLGFSQEEYEAAFKLYNRTHIQPMQQIIVDTFAKVFGMEGVLEIVPFSMETSTQTIE